jgi:2-polyprenyl-3-methyl-5-hydroxy-6-metoxy-1,4-benzoquinol methylase
LFRELKEINTRPRPFEFYTADELWTDAHTSKQMLEYHLNESVDASSRNKGFIERSVEWITSRFEVDKTTKIADFGCGPGLYTTRLAERGAIVTGIDFSDFDLITMIMCDFCVLSHEQRKTMLSKFNSLLKPDGSVLLDVYSLNTFNQKEESATYELNQLNGFWSPADYYCVKKARRI